MFSIGKIFARSIHSINQNSWIMVVSRDRLLLNA